MALHTIDMKTTSAGDVQPLRATPGGIGPVTDNTDAVVPYIVGYQQGGFGELDYGIKVAKQGFDARTATADELVMSSQFNMFKIIASGVVSVSKPANSILGGITIDISSLGLTAAPAYAVYGGESAYAFSQTPRISATNAGLVDLHDETSSQPTELIISVFTPNVAGSVYYSAALDWEYTYYIFQETAS